MTASRAMPSVREPVNKNGAAGRKISVETYPRLFLLRVFCSLLVSVLDITYLGGVSLLTRAGVESMLWNAKIK